MEICEGTLKILGKHAFIVKSYLRLKMKAIFNGAPIKGRSKYGNLNQKLDSMSIIEDQPYILYQ